MELGPVEVVEKTAEIAAKPLPAVLSTTTIRADVQEPKASEESSAPAEPISVPHVIRRIVIDPGSRR